MALVTTTLADGIFTIAMDDGKANVLSPAMQAELNTALDTAQANDDAKAIVLTGREGRFSAGFDLGVLQGGGEEALNMLRGGFELSHRLLSLPKPVVMACNGHAIAMGVFLLLSGDYAVGTAGSFKIMANEVAIGLTMPLAAVEICRHRLAPAHFNRAVITAEMYDPQGAIAAGFLDEVVDAADLAPTANAAAARLAALHPAAFANTKVRAREAALNAIQAGIEADDAGLRAQFG
jgi:enoyl-CoA hydratase